MSGSGGGWVVPDDGGRGCAETVGVPGCGWRVEAVSVADWPCWVVAVEGDVAVLPEPNSSV
jgi:hypothetical protein